MVTSRYQVVNAKTGEVLGVVERYRRDVTPPNHKGMAISRVWWRIEGTTHNADTRATLAGFLGHSSNCRTRMLPLN